MRVERIGNATLYLGDCLEALPLIGKFDAIITDPPYGINADALNSKTPDDPNGWRHYGTPPGWDKERRPKEIRELVAAGVPSIIWGGNYYTDILPPSMGWLVWDKGQDEFSLADVEFAWWSEWRAARRIRYPRALAIKEGGHHPTQKPIKVMEWCVAKTEGVVLDAMMGSGTTGVACVNLGRPFIGIELHEPYFDIACERIENAQRQDRLFA